MAADHPPLPILFLTCAVLRLVPGATAQPMPADPFESIKSLAGEWQADLPGYGTISNSIRLVSHGTAVEETIGTATDNEVSLYTRDGGRILLTHFCALTPGGHQVRLLTRQHGTVREGLVFDLASAINLRDPAAPHMRRVVMAIADRDHFIERWTQKKAGKDVVFDLHFVRR